MKLFLPAFALLCFVLGCTKHETENPAHKTEYIVICQFQTYEFFSNGKRILFVTNSDGDILHQFEIPEDADHLQEQFSIEGEGLPERYDLHLLKFLDGTDQSVRVFSHLDIPNGGSVYFPHPNGIVQINQSASLRIEGIESFDSLNIAGGYVTPDFQSAQKTIYANASIRANHGMVVRLRANGASEFRHLYVPDSLIPFPSYADTAVLNWQDFKPENNLRTFEIPGNNGLVLLEVTAITPDNKQFVALERLYMWPTNGQSILPQFNHPDGLPEPVAYRIRAETSDFSFEKIFQPSEALHFEPANMTVDSFKLYGRDMQVKASGNIDLLRAEAFIYVPNNTNDIDWTIEGSPEALQERTLPDLSAYLPSWYQSPSSMTSVKVSALQFDNYDYQQVREGFPYKLTEPYAKARSGYKAVWRWWY